MQILNLDYHTSAQTEIVGGAAPKAIASSGAAAIAFGSLTLTKTFSLVNVGTIHYQAASTGSAMALSIASPNRGPNASGILASGRATVSSKGKAQS
jgi:hypothetical protein